jgi:hypothetical protein
MPQPNDAELTALYTASTGCDVEDSEPNTPAPGAAVANNFQLQLEAAAGNALGAGGADYQLSVTCIDDTLAAPNGAMSPGQFNQSFNAGDGWTACGTAGNFVKKQTFNINVPAANVRGHEFHYIATLVAVDSGVVSFIESNRFILV